MTSLCQRAVGFEEGWRHNELAANENIPAMEIAKLAIFT